MNADKIARLRELFETWLASRPSFRTTVEAQAAWEGWKANTAVAAMLAEYDAQPAQAAQPMGVPDGWVMVPKRDVTSDMIRVGMEWITNCQTDFDRACMVTCIFGEMCKVAPQPPAQPSADAVKRLRRVLDAAESVVSWDWSDNDDDAVADITRLFDAVKAARAAEGDG